MPNFSDAELKEEQIIEDATTFSKLGLSPALLESLAHLGYEAPSPIQAQTIPLLLDGHDVIGLAQTGTGKTAAFALPALSSLLQPTHGKTSNAPKILVLTPTRELALQVSEAFTSYAMFINGFKIVPVYGGASYEPQLNALRRGVDVVVGTPGRVIDHLERGSLDLSHLEYVVLDEADEMLRMGFSEAVETILSRTPEDKQVALFSATMPSAIRRIGQKYLRSPREVTVHSKVTTGENVYQRYVKVTQSNKLDALTRILEVGEYEGIIIFVRTKQATEELAEHLRARGFTAQAINGDKPQQQREQAVEALRAGLTDILVATDIAARGLDVERISLVINYDIPMDDESYVHRIGRTGRAGRAGEAILFVTPRQTRLLRSIEKTTRQKIDVMQLPSVESINDARQRKLFERIDKAIQSVDLSPFAELVKAYQQEHEISSDDMAAGLIAMLQGDNPFFAEELREPVGRDSRDDGNRRKDKERRNYSATNLATYRIAVGHKDRVQPRTIVGALSNEAGIPPQQIGRIDIRSTFSLVELPPDLSDRQRGALSRTHIAGRPIRCEPDAGKPRRQGSQEGYGADSRNFKSGKFNKNRKDKGWSKKKY